VLSVLATFSTPIFDTFHQPHHNAPHATTMWKCSHFLSFHSTSFFHFIFKWTHLISSPSTIFPLKQYFYPSEDLLQQKVCIYDLSKPCVFGIVFTLLMHMSCLLSCSGEYLRWKCNANGANEQLECTYIRLLSIHSPNPFSIIYSFLFIVFVDLNICFCRNRFSKANKNGEDIM